MWNKKNRNHKNSLYARSKLWLRPQTSLVTYRSCGHGRRKWGGGGRMGTAAEKLWGDVDFRCMPFLVVILQDIFKTEAKSEQIFLNGDIFDFRGRLTILTIDSSLTQKSVVMLLSVSYFYDNVFAIDGLNLTGNSTKQCLIMTQGPLAERDHSHNIKECFGTQPPSSWWMTPLLGRQRTLNGGCTHGHRKRGTERTRPPQWKS